MWNKKMTDLTTKETMIVTGIITAASFAICGMIWAGVAIYEKVSYNRAVRSSRKETGNED